MTAEVVVVSELEEAVEQVRGKFDECLRVVESDGFELFQGRVHNRVIHGLLTASATLASVSALLRREAERRAARAEEES